MKELIIKCYEESDGIIPIYRFPKDGLNIPIVGELIRCKDCKHFDGDKWCYLFEHGIQENDFCSRAEKE